MIINSINKLKSKLEFHCSQKYHQDSSSSNQIREEANKRLKATRSSQLKSNEMMDIFCPKEQLVNEGMIFKSIVTSQ